MASVTVRGSAEREVDPDRVRITVTVEGEAAEADQALADLAERSAALDELIEQAGEAILARRPSSVSVGPTYDRNGQVRGQTARRTVTVEARPVGQLGELLARAVDVAGTSLGGMQWLVEPGNAVHASLRAEAAADARMRAEVYAEAVGMRLGQLDWIAEPGLGTGPPPEPGLPRARTMLAAAMEQADSSRILDLQPEPISVTAEVEARYALLPGPVDRESGNYL
jgi:uncharacterized protein